MLLMILRLLCLSLFLDLEHAFAEENMSFNHLWKGKRKLKRRSNIVQQISKAKARFVPSSSKKLCAVSNIYSHELQMWLLKASVATQNLKGENWDLPFNHLFLLLEVKKNCQRIIDHVIYEQKWITFKWKMRIQILSIRFLLSLWGSKNEILI